MTSLRVIFVFSNLTFPPREGLHVQSVALIRSLRRKGIEVGVVALVRDSSMFSFVEFENYVGGLQFLDVFPTHLNYPSLMVRNLFWPTTCGRLGRFVRKRTVNCFSTVVHLDGIGLAPLLGCLNTRRVVMSTVDAWSLRQRRLAGSAGFLKRLALRWYESISAYVEKRYFPRAGAVHVVSATDAAYLADLVPTARLRVIPVAIPSFPAMRESVDLSRNESLRVVFWGDIAVPHLRQGLIWLFEAVRPNLPLTLRNRIEWVVMGRREPDERLRSACPGARFLAWVDDVDAMLQSADVVVLPDASGTGLKNRALHAMACRVSVIGSEFAFEGIPVEHGNEAFVCSDPKGFAEALGILLSSPALRGETASRAARFVRERYSMERVRDQWLALYDEVVALEGHCAR